MPQQPIAASVVLAAWSLAAAGAGCVLVQDTYEIAVPVHIANSSGDDIGDDVYYGALVAVSRSVCDTAGLSHTCLVVDMERGPDTGTPRLEGTLEGVDEECRLELLVVAFVDDPGNTPIPQQDCHAESLERPFVRDTPIDLDVADPNCNDHPVGWCDFSTWSWEEP